MGKKLQFVSGLGQIDKNVYFSESSILQNVTHIADIFFPPPHHHLGNTIGKYNSNGTTMHRTLPIATAIEDIPIFKSPIDLDSSHKNESQTYAEGLTHVTFFQEFQDLYIQFLFQCLSWAVMLIAIWSLNRILMKSKILEFLPKFIASWLLALVLLPAISSLLGFLLLCRLMIRLYLKTKYNNRVFLAHPMDASWAFETYASPSTCTGLYVVDGKCRPERILETFENCMKIRIDEKFMYERMSYCLRYVFGFVCWEKSATFQAKNHVKLISKVNPKLDGAVTEMELFEELRRLHDEPFENSDVPPWEILVFPHYVPQNKPQGEYYALVFRIHHAIMDGVSTGNALHTGIADKPFKFTLDPLDPLKVSKLQIWIAHVIAILMLPLTTIRNLCLFERHAFHGELLRGKKNFRWTKAIKLEALKKMKNASRTSIFAVLMNCIAGAFRNLFIMKNEPVPEVIHAAPPVAILPFPDRVLRNRFSIVIFPMKIGIENVLTRLDQVFQAAKDLARSSDILANYFTMQILGLHPLFLIKFLGSFAHATMTLSNIPGPAETVTMFGGDRLVDVGAWVPVKITIGIGMALFSYADRLRVTIIADEASLPKGQDVEYLMNEFEDQLSEMAKLLDVDQPLFYD